LITIQYLGGKSRISKQISEVINNEVSRWEVKNITTDSGNNPEREREREYLTFVSLFCGSCSIESKVKGFDKVICNDKHEYLIELFKGVQNGYELPELITEEQYKYIREHKDENKILTGFVGFGCSFGGKWFGGFARNKTNTNYALQSKKSLLKDMDNLMTAQFTCQDYRDVIIPNNSIVYADPPYNNTTGYGKDKFNSDEFWEYMRVISKNNKVFISEQTAPNDFECVWEKEFTRTLDVNKDNQFKVTEKLFTYKN
jgi:DNA adenine methylase